MTRTVEEQVDAAIGTYRLDWRVDSAVTDVLRKAMIELMAGKFAKEPLPKIVVPGWASQAYTEVETDKNRSDYMLHNVVAVTTSDLEFTGHVRGPQRKTQREAIEAWNAGMRR